MNLDLLEIRVLLLLCAQQMESINCINGLISCDYKTLLGAIYNSHSKDEIDRLKTLQTVNVILNSNLPNDEKEMFIQSLDD